MGPVGVRSPDETPFSVDLDLQGKYVVVHVTGALDMATSPLLRVAFEPMWESVREGCLILNLTSMTFCDSSGVGALIAAFKQCRERRTRLLLAGVPLYLLRMLRTTQLITLFETHATLEEALVSSADGA
ncbi:anti-sigma factor antagonist [Planobispora longispora]|uniref:Anti-sigma factor antagonist n=2 Tax=Planobispora longispora TaxID=28887 RepID=A0A8J3RFF6_9ACTN|nr:STAS domain-containing protein [Planobispora longispora]GIH75266.1 anti-sigma factor antagonist [Planobispora longispora]